MFCNWNESNLKLFKSFSEYELEGVGRLQTNYVRNQKIMYLDLKQDNNCTLKENREWNPLIPCFIDISVE